MALFVKIKYKVIGTGVKPDSFRCDIPTYNMIQQISASPRVWEIAVPKSFVNDSGNLVNKKIRNMYRYTKRELAKLTPDARTQVNRWKSFDYAANQVP